MAFLTDNEWYRVTFRQTNDAAWGALSSFPGIPAALLEHIVAGTSVIVYVTNAVAGDFAFYGGAAFNFDDTVLAAIPTPISDLTTTDDSGSTFSSMVDVATGDWYTYGQANNITKYSAAEAAALKAFLP